MAGRTDTDDWRFRMLGQPLLEDLFVLAVIATVLIMATKPIHRSDTHHCGNNRTCAQRVKDRSSVSTNALPRCGREDIP